MIDVAGLAGLPDPFRVRVAEVLAAHGETLPSA